MRFTPEIQAVPPSFEWFPDHTKEERMAFVRTAREVLRTGRHEDGRTISSAARELIESYLARELRALRPRLVEA